MNRIHLLRPLFLSLVLILVISYSAFATHLRAGEITVERVNCSSLTFRITVTVFTNTINTNVLFGGEDDWLDFGDGNRMLVPETDNTPRPDLGEGIATASFTITHTYSGNGKYVISYSEPNRNAGVLNMDGSVNTRFYIETLLIIDPFLGCNNSPKLLVPPIDRACKGIAWFHNPGAYDPDGDSLSYELVIPFRDNNTTVVNYKDPADPKFYTDYQTANENASGPPSFLINPIDGTLTWDAPGAIGEYNIAFVIREWRLVNGIWVSIGFVRRDMQIIVDDCENERPELEVPEDVCVEAGSVLDATILGTDPDGDSVKIEAFSEILNLAEAQSPATVTPFPARFAKQPAELKFHWQTDCAHVKDQPYQVVFKITDKSPTGSRLVTFKTWFIRVVGPEPTWVNASVDLPTRSANLQWNPYFCQNAETIQIWRRVDSFEFQPDSCQTGMPDGLGYNLIGTVPVKDINNNPVTTYTDTNEGRGLASGAQYCYRLVAAFPLPRGGES
ncbi:MAG TPA: gliding motility-associated C-terminal domain-containing protein, partial [Chryseosolibacter sp.]